jgi:glycosyltransferase involved in cell wall biosynthesis
MEVREKDPRIRVILANHSVYPYHPYGGVEKRIYYLAKALLTEGADVEIVTSSPKANKVKADEFEGITYTFIPPHVEWKSAYDVLDTIRLVFFAFNLSRYLKRKQFDLLYCSLTVPYFYLHLKKRAFVLFQPFEEIYEFKGSLLKSKGAVSQLKVRLVHHLKGRVDRYCMTHADLIASEGEFQTDIFLTLFGINKEKVLELPVAVDIPSIDIALKAGTLSRQDLGLEDNDMVLISVNRLVSSKGVNYLVKAFDLLKQQVTNAKLILVGSGAEEKAIREQIVSCGLADSIVHLKDVPDNVLYNYYALSDIYVSPTLDTGSIQGVIEAMACSLPVVSTGQDFWVKDGVNGFVVPKRNPEAMAEAILKVCTGGHSKQFGEASRRIAEGYDYRMIAKTASAKYEELSKSRE